MDAEDKPEGVRVTRARTRRLSILDTDSQPSTPVLEIAPDRASPRPTRRARLNAVEAPLTPGRITRRASIARGETPEPPTTPSMSAAKRSSAKRERTPAVKNARKQLPLAEDISEEMEDAMSVVSEVSDYSECFSRPTSALSLEKKPLSTPSSSPTDRRVTRSMSESPKQLKESSVSPTAEKEAKQAETKQPVVRAAVKSSVELEGNTSVELRQSLETSISEAMKHANNESAEEREKADDEAMAPKLAVRSPSAISPKVMVRLRDFSQTPTKSKEEQSKTDLEDKPKAAASSQLKEKVVAASKLPKSPKEAAEALGKRLSLEDIEFESFTENKSEREPEAATSSSLEAELKAAEAISKTPAKEKVAVPSPKFFSKTPTNVKPVAKTPTATDDVIAKLEVSIKEVEAKTKKDEQKDKVAASPKLPKIDVELKGQEEKPTAAANDSDVELNTSMEELAVAGSKIDGGQVIEIIKLPDLTPGIKSRVLPEEHKEEELIKKSVGFENAGKAGEDGRLKYPKTPARVKAVNIGTVNLATSEAPIKEAEEIESESHTPYKMKSALLQARSSSTPVEQKNEAASELKRAPAQIDAIRPLEEEEKPIKRSPAAKLPASRLAFLASDDEDDMDEDVEEDGEVYLDSEFIEHEVEVAENYQSGDSMDSSERRDLEENEVHIDGESVGSVDTSEEDNEDMEAEDGNSIDSFIVSDTEQLAFSSEDEEEKQTVSKKRRRIVAMSDSSEEEKKRSPEQHKEEDEEEPIVQRTSISLSNASKLSDAAQMLNNSVEQHSDSNELLESSRQALLQELNRSERLNKTATQLLDVSVAEVSSEEEEEKEEGEVDVHSLMSGIKRLTDNKSIYEIFDSTVEEDMIKTSPDMKQRRLSKSFTDGKDKAKESPPARKSRSFVEDKASGQQESESETETEPDPQPCSSKSKSRTRSFHEKEKVEAELELPSDLNHLKQLFNPLQKSRRQTLYVQSPEDREPRLKRRSELLSSNDFNPSQSFVETLAESQQRQQSKRMRLSKSFCGAVELEKKEEKSPAVEEEMPANEEEPPTVEKEMPAVEEKSPAAAEEPSAQIAAIEEPPAAQVEPKTRDYYIEYCDSLLNEANAAMLKQKQQDIAAGKKKKNKKISAAVVKPNPEQVVVEDNSSLDKPVKLKKDVKRLQATRQAVKHAVQLILPANPRRSIEEKLAPQPPKTVKTKKVVVVEKQRKPAAATAPVQSPSPTKSSDEENRQHTLNRIKTSAGYVTISKAHSPPRRIELIKLSSGIMKVEPSTPNQKYFREVGCSPMPPSGFREEPGTPRRAKRAPKQLSHATETALRFKQQVFGRKY